MGTLGWATTAAEAVAALDLRGRTIVVTGASSGIGAETVRVLASAGARVVMGVRDRVKGESVAATIAGDVAVEELDLRDLSSVDRFAGAIPGPVHVLIANAGVSKTPDAHLPNGLDVRFATNHLGHFLLAHRLRPGMIKAGGARIVVLSSGGHKGNPVHLDDLQWHAREHVDGMAYAESKSANICFAMEATRRWSGDRIFANAVLPGSALTGLQRFHGEELKRRIGFLDAEGNPTEKVKTTEQAAATSVWAATAPELEGRGGLVLEDCGEAEIAGPDTHPWFGYDPSVADPETARRLWEISLGLLEELGHPVDQT